MTTMQLTAKKELRRRIAALSEYETKQVLSYIDSLAEHEPNEETIAAMRDVMEGRNLSKTYDDVEEMMKDLLEETYA